MKDKILLHLEIWIGHWVSLFSAMVSIITINRCGTSWPLLYCCKTTKKRMEKRLMETKRII